MLGFSFDLLEQLTFYGSYHSNRWNQLIHFVFVPLIAWSVLVWACYTGPLFGVDLPQLSEHVLPRSIARYCVFNLAAILPAALTAWYLKLDFFAGLSWGIFMAAPLFVAANALQQSVGRAWAWALAAHCLGWYMQIHPGHGVFEKRKPALLDSFLQSLTLAPLFVWFELLFLLGYRPRLYAQLQQRVAANIAALKMEGIDTAADAQPPAKQPLLADQK